MNNNNSYPFMSKKQIAERIAADADFALFCIVMLNDRTTARKPGDKACGFMSSHLATGTKIAKKIASGEGEVTAEEVAAAQKMAGHYTKQIAAQLRAEAKAENPELAAVAAVFGC